MAASSQASLWLHPGNNLVVAASSQTLRCGCIETTAVMSASHFSGVATVFCPQGLVACAGRELPLPVRAEANKLSRSSMSKVMFGQPVGVGRREESAMFGRGLPTSKLLAASSNYHVVASLSQHPFCCSIEATFLLWLYRVNSLIFGCIEATVLYLHQGTNLVLAALKHLIFAASLQQFRCGCIAPTPSLCQERGN